MEGDLIMGYRLKLTFVSTIFWYISTVFYIYFFDIHYKWDTLIVLSNFVFIFVLFFFLNELMYYFKLYKKKILIFLYSIIITGLFYFYKIIDREFFNYFSLFFTNILYSFMIGYSLKSKYLL